MTIQRTPHPIFAAYWLLWYGAVVAAVLMPNHPTFGLIVLVSFLPAEGVAVATKSRGNARDTLSETFTWVQRKLARDRDLVRGWNAVLLLLVLFATWLLARTVHHYSGNWLIAGITFVLATIWLVDHWWHPETRG